jgi:hypothetical protein
MWQARERREKCTSFWWKKTEGKRPHGRPRLRREDEFRMDLRERDWGCGVDLVGSG